MMTVSFWEKLRARSARAMLVIGLTTAALVCALEQAGMLARLDHFVLDRLLEYTASGKAAVRAVVVDIDDESLSAVGQWPWPRYRIAALLEAIAARQPAAIGVDVLFSEPDRTSLVNIQRSFKRDFGVDMSFTDVPPGLTDNDGYLGHVFSRTGAVAAKYFYFDRRTSSERPHAPQLRFSGDMRGLSLHRASGVLLNTDAIASKAMVSGFINTQPDDDGYVRRLPLLIEHDGAIHPHLALATIMTALQTRSATIARDGSGPLIHVGSHSIPIDREGFAILRFEGKPQLYRAIPAVDVLAGALRDEDLKGKIVFVGSSAAGLHDLHSTAFDPQFAGLKVQAVVAENVLTNRFVREPDWALGAILVECIAAGALMSTLFIMAGGALAMSLASAMLVVGILAVGMALFQGAALFVSPVPGVLVVALLFVAFTVARFALERRRASLAAKRLENARQVTIESMAAVAETRDPDTGGHIKRTQHYVRAIAQALQRSGNYPNTLTDEYVDMLFLSAPLHDIGKVGVPDHILLKPGPLTDGEYAVMKQHAELGRKIIFSTAKAIEGDNFLALAGEMAATHHERWDGLGYPLGLAGQDIPLSGRIMCVADVYDALISQRCYKEPFSHETAIGILREARGRIFDPVVLDAFFAIENAIKAIAESYRDEEGVAPAQHDARSASTEQPSGAVPRIAT